jgi:hypothetical protein
LIGFRALLNWSLPLLSPLSSDKTSYRQGKSHITDCLSLVVVGMQAIGIPAADHAAGARLIAEPSVIDVAKKPVVWSAPTKQKKRNETKRPASFKHLNLNPKACDGWMDGALRLPSYL